MSNTYTWKIEALDVKPSAGDLKDYVVTAHWRCTGTDGNDHFGDVYSTVPFQIDEEKTDYNHHNSMRHSNFDNRPEVRRRILAL